MGLVEPAHAFTSKTRSYVHRLCKESSSAAFWRLTYSQSFLRRRKLRGSSPTRCNWSSQSTSNVLCRIKLNSPATFLVFYTADVAPQLLLRPLHCLVSVLSERHLPSQVPQVLYFIPRGDAVQSSESISVWTKAIRITQCIFPCTNSHDYYRQLG
jgi:hypothetical protein